MKPNAMTAESRRVVVGADGRIVRKPRIAVAVQAAPRRTVLTDLKSVTLFVLLLASASGVVVGTQQDTMWVSFASLGMVAVSPILVSKVHGSKGEEEAK